MLNKPPKQRKGERYAHADGFEPKLLRRWKAPESVSKRHCSSFGTKNECFRRCSLLKNKNVGRVLKGGTSGAVPWTKMGTLINGTVKCTVISMEVPVWTGPMRNSLGRT